MTRQSNPWDGLFDSNGDPLDRLPDAVHAGVSAIVFNERNEVLLQKISTYGKWAPPAGYIDPGEAAHTTAVRETFEETGMTVEIKRLVGVYSDPANFSIRRNPRGELIQYVSIVYEATVVSGELRISEESTDVGWFPVDDLPNETASAARIRIEDALKGGVKSFSK